MKVPFIDVAAAYRQYQPELVAALAGVLERGDFILGEQVRCFEEEFASWCGSQYAVGVNSGSDALFLSLLAMGIGPGDEVICPVYTYIATALSISQSGAKPVFCDIAPQTFLSGAEQFRLKITRRTRAIIPVHLYGCPADMPAIMALAHKYRLAVIEDVAQAHGAGLRQPDGSCRQAGTFGAAGCFSFYPTKNLGGCGDGGLVTTDQKRMYERLQMLRDQGRKGSKRYVHHVRAYNSRLDSFQAALLRVKLRHLDEDNKKRRQVAAWYRDELASLPMVLPLEPVNGRHVYHIYATRLKQRDRVMAMLKEKGIASAAVYPLALHLQPAYRDLGLRRGDFPQAEKASRSVLCLPMHPTLTQEQVHYVGQCLREVLSE